MFNKLKNLYTLLKEHVFELFPVTMVAVWIATVIGAIVVDNYGDSWVQVYRLLYIVLTFAAGSLFVEEWFGGKKMWRIVGYGISFVLAVCFIAFLTLDAKVADSMGLAVAQEWVAKLFVCYLIWVLGLSLCHMFKRSGKDFAEYCMIAFGSLMKTTLVHGLFALGVLIIMLIVDALLFDVNEAIMRVEIVLAGWIYVPGLILAISDVEKKVSRFFQLVIKFVLMPLLIAAFAIIYLYIVKLIVTWDLPDNEVFPILTFLFCVGLPIWTMGSVFADTKMGKAAQILPYVFVPFILLQILCIGLRVHQYGITEERYMGIFLIVFETGYLVLYSIYGKRYISGAILLIMVLVTIFLLMPGLCYEDMSYHTHKKVLTHALSLTSDQRAGLSKAQKKRLLGAYDEIQHMRAGKNLVKALSQDEKDWIDQISEDVRGYHETETKYINASKRQKKVAVDGYRYLTEFSVYTDNQKKIDLTHMKVNYGDDESFEQDLSEFVLEAERIYDKEKEAEQWGVLDEWLMENNEIRTSNGGKLIVEYFYISKEDDEYRSISISGYYLE